MSLHSYSRCWLHLVWATLNREPLLSKHAAAEASKFLTDYSLQNGIYMKINYFNAEHTHALIDLPTGVKIEDTAKLFKGASSHWINEKDLVPGKFRWGRGYGAFSVSASDVDTVANYIARQEEHHKRRTFKEEFERLVIRYGLTWSDEGR